MKIIDKSLHLFRVSSPNDTSIAIHYMPEDFQLQPGLHAGMVNMKLYFQMAEQNYTILPEFEAKEHDITVDNKSAADNNKNILFLLDNKYELQKAIGVILAVNLMWAVEPVPAKVEMKLVG